MMMAATRMQTMANPLPPPAETPATAETVFPLNSGNW
jgi:hypothetical protein